MSSTSTPSKDILVGGRVIGKLKGKTLYKTVRESKHLFRKLDAWGIDYDVLHKELPEDGSIYLHDVENFVIYMASNRLWKADGVILHFKEGTKDHYTQVFLPRKLFDVVRRPDPTPAPAPAPVEPPKEPAHGVS